MNDKIPLIVNEQKRTHFVSPPQNYNYDNACEITIDEKLQANYPEIPMQPVLIANTTPAKTSYCTPLSACMWLGIFVILIIIIVAIAASYEGNVYPYSNKTGNYNSNFSNSTNPNSRNKP